MPKPMTHVSPAPGALEEWTGLVAARWTIVERFDDHGHHYLLARRNDPELPDLSLLSERERQVTAQACLGRSNKLIAYELGLATSTVGVLLWRAATKLKADSRAALIEAFRRSTSPPAHSIGPARSPLAIASSSESKS